MRNLGSNTFGERTHYVLPVAAEGAARRTPDCAKAMYVSPFNEADGHYDFTFLALDEKLRLTASLSRGQGRVLSAWIAGERRPLTDAGIAKAFLARPLQAYAVTAGIHWEALKFWRKSMTIKPRPRRDAGHVPPAEEPAR